MGLTQAAEGEPIPGQPGQVGPVTFGESHVLDLVARVANQHPKAAWYHKWLVHRGSDKTTSRPRPRMRLK